MSNARRWTLWILLLSASAALVLFDGDDNKGASSESAVVEAAVPGSRGAATDAIPRRTQEQEDTMILAIRERKSARDIRDTFSPHDWTPPAPPPPPHAPVVAPAPPVPYKVLGKILEDGEWQVFLTHQKGVYVVKQGDSLDNTYRVEEIRPPTMVLTYLPMNERQVLAIGGEQ